MKEVIRFSTFESNSSSSHSIVILNKADAERWKDGDLYAIKDNFYYYEDDDARLNKCKLYTKEEILDYIKKYNKYFEPSDIEEYGGEEEYLNSEGFATYSNWEDIELEEEETEFVTPGGEEMVAFCKYGMEY